MFWRPWEDVPEPESDSRDSTKKTRRSKLDKNFQRAIFDAYAKAVRGGSGRPITDVCETLNLNRSVVSRVLRRGRPLSPKKRGPKAQFTRVDSSVEERIRNIVHQNYKDRKEPTVQSLYAEVKENLPEFPYGKTSFHRLLKEMGFRFKKVASNKYVWTDVPERARRQF